MTAVRTPGVRHLVTKGRDALRARVPPRRRRQALKLRIALRAHTARWRLLPDFLVIGAQRGGTSSLYRYLGQHPRIVPALRKEVCYLTYENGRGVDWYRAHFPISTRRALRSRVRGAALLTFEATPDYLFHPLAPSRAAELVPGARLIALLRNPVDRAYSHYQHQVRLGAETLSFAEAIHEEKSRLEGGLERLRGDPDFERRNFLGYSYVHRGLYAEQLARWLDVYPREQLLIVESERFYHDPAAVYAEIVAFLGLPSYEPYAFRNYSYAPGQERSPTTLDATIRQELEEVFREANERLFEMLGQRFDWNESVR